MTRILTIASVAVVLALASFTVWALPVIHGSASVVAVRPTPSASPEPPLLTQIDDHGLTWEDQAVEDGYRVELKACGQTFTYELPANSTSFKYPNEYLRARDHCSKCSPETAEVLIMVTAFNAVGESTMTTGSWDSCGPPPPAPQNVVLSGDTLRWTRGSYDPPESLMPGGKEDGFDIHLWLCNQTFDYQVSAATTTFQLPEETKPYQECFHCGCSSLTVDSFNASGESWASPANWESGGIIGGCADCAPAATATPVVITMPPTGTGSDGAGWNWQAVALAGGIASMAVGTVAVIRARRGSNES